MDDEIFLSYSNQDRAAAKRLAEALEGRGFGVWWDKEIPPGKTFDQVIEERLDAAKAVVVLWSAHSVRSQWVRTEAGEALERGVLVPALIEEVRIPLAFRRIEAAQLAGWAGETSDPEFRQLEAVLRSLTGSKAPAAETAADGTPAPAVPAAAGESGGVEPAGVFMIGGGSGGPDLRQVEAVVRSVTEAAAPLARASAAPPPTAGSSAETPGRGGPGRLLLAIAGIAALLVLAFLGRAVLQQRGKEASPSKPPQTVAPAPSRTADRIAWFRHSKGGFEKTSRGGRTVWVEHHEEHAGQQFLEVKRDQTWIVARDESRKFTIRFPVAGGWCQLREDGQREWSRLYEVTPGYR